MQHLDLQNGTLDLLNCSISAARPHKEGTFHCCGGEGGGVEKMAQIACSLTYYDSKRSSFGDGLGLPPRPCSRR